jgi:hypothetical protein
MGLVSNDFKNSVSSKLSQLFLGFSFFSPLPKALLPLFSNPFHIGSVYITLVVVFYSIFLKKFAITNVLPKKFSHCP